MLALDAVYQYRVLLGKCASGAGLSLDEIEQFSELEATFAAGPEDIRAAEGRRHRREPVAFSAVVRGGALHDAVTIAEIAPGGMVCHGAPYAEVGTILDILIEDAATHRAYRFKGRVQWIGDDADDDYRLGLELTGTPVLIRYLVPTTVDPMLVRLAA